jgi:hypothetical protein
MKQPVPYVFFASPGSKQHWPINAACWSPSAPAMRILAPKGPSARVVPKASASELATMRGKTERGIRSSSRIS